MTDLADKPRRAGRPTGEAGRLGGRQAGRQAGWEAGKEQADPRKKERESIGHAKHLAHRTPGCVNQLSC